MYQIEKRKSGGGRSCKNLCVYSDLRRSRCLRCRYDFLESRKATRSELFSYLTCLNTTMSIFKVSFHW